MGYLDFMRKTLVLLSICLALIISSKVFAIDQNAFLTTQNNIYDKTFVDYDWLPYVDKMSQKLKSNWFPPKYGNNVEIIFKITKDGKYKDLRISKPSKYKEDNQAAIDAVMFTAPFDPVPIFVNELIVKYSFPGESKTAINNKEAIEVVVID